MLKAGFSSIEITPQKPYPMAGFDLRKEVSTGVHDPLFARALVLDDGGHLCAIGSLDLLGVPAYMAAEIRRMICQKLPIPEDAIQLSAIHTHAAPQSIFRTFSCYDEEYAALICRGAAEAIIKAYKSRHAVTTQYVHTDVGGIACRRDCTRKASAYDMPCDSLLFRSVESGQNDILLSVYACHPTVLNESNTQISRDLVYGCEKRIRERCAYTDVLFLNGACADLSTRYTRLASSFEETERLGGRWADALLASLERAEPLPGGIRIHKKALFVPPADFFSDGERKTILAYLENKIESCPDISQKREYIACRSVLQRKTYGKGEGCVAELGIIAIGNILFCFLPFEYASGDAALLKQTLDEKSGCRTVICCYSNGYEGYLPSGRPLDRDSGYEDMASPFRYDAKICVAEAFERMLEDV